MTSDELERVRKAVESLRGVLSSERLSELDDWVDRDCDLTTDSAASMVQMILGMKQRVALDCQALGISTDPPDDLKSECYQLGEEVRKALRGERDD